MILKTLSNERAEKRYIPQERNERDRAVGEPMVPTPEDSCREGGVQAVATFPEAQKGN